MPMREADGLVNVDDPAWPLLLECGTVGLGADQMDGGLVIGSNGGGLSE
ncbi:hypothetical protein ACH4KU_07900 [Streptomyces althioticus]